MATSIFDDKQIVPDNDMLKAVLCTSNDLWKQLEEHLFDTNDMLKKEWKFYSKKAGWTLIFKAKKRTLLYFIPQKEYFEVWFVFGNKAIEVVVNSTLPSEIIDRICTAPSYAEGTSFNITVKEASDVGVIKQLLEIKKSN